VNEVKVNAHFAASIKTGVSGLFPLLVAHSLPGHKPQAAISNIVWDRTMANIHSLIHEPGTTTQPIMSSDDQYYYDEDTETALDKVKRLFGENKVVSAGKS
jgi:hypothetical protein